LDGEVTNPLYFFHIPKTGGRFFFINSTNVLKHELLIKKKDPKLLHGYGHISFKPIDTQPMLSFSILREPVSRTISHYLHIYENRLSGDITADKKKFIDFLVDNPEDGIIDYQCKYIAYDGDDYLVDITNKGLSKTLTTADLTLVLSRISKVDYLFDMPDLGYELMDKARSIMYKHFELETDYPVIRSNYPMIVNEESSALLAALTPAEKSLIEGILKNDMELYNLANFTKDIL